MKRIFLLALGAVASTGNLKADPEIVIHSTHAEEDARAAAGAQAAYLASLEHYFETLAQNALTPHDPKVRALYNNWLARKARQNAEAKSMLATDSLTEGDPVPEIGDLYDTPAMIRIYLHDSGYNDSSDADVTRIATYMHAHGIRHVSQLGQ